jgi:chemotaxis protein methyltransferase CheR
MEVENDHSVTGSKIGNPMTKRFEGSLMFSAELKDIDYERISRLVYEQCGINLHEGKRELVRARLGKRLREGKFKSFGDYYHYVTTDEGTDELICMIDSISTNLTYFFREESHYHTLQKITPDLSSSIGRRKTLWLWSAGCSTGEEPYSLAMTILEAANGSMIDAKIVATDISTKVLRTAVAGVFHKDKLKNVSDTIRSKYFQTGRGEYEGLYRIKKYVSEMIQFSRFNLMEIPPPNYQFDVIFCRNVMIYFDKQTQSALVKRFYNCLNDGGYLFVGHSESLTGLHHNLKYIEPSVYRK